MSESKATNNILCMGSINIDLVMFMDKMPLPGQTIVTDNFNTFPGGKGGNQAVAASLLGGNVRFFGKLSDDNFSVQLKETMVNANVDVSGILTEPGKTAGVAIIWVDASGQNSITFTPGANALLTPEEVRAHSDEFQTGGILLIGMEIAPETVFEAIRVAHEKDMLVILDPAPAPSQPFPADIPGMVDIVKPNETEATAITGIDVVDFESAEKAVTKLLDMGFDSPVVTLGEQGAVAWVDEQIVRIDPVKVDVVDSTAAGDVFSGALAASLAQGNDLMTALTFAKTAAALSTTVRGAQTSIPTLEFVNEHLG